MELREAILNRRSYRAFTDEPVAREQVDTIIETGLWAPSGMASQSAIIVELVDVDVKAQLEGVANVCIGHPVDPDATPEPRKPGRVYKL